MVNRASRDIEFLVARSAMKGSIILHPTLKALVADAAPFTGRCSVALWL